VAVTLCYSTRGVPVASIDVSKVQVTPEMIAAGLDVLYAWDIDDYVRDECISAVYIAMEKARLQSQDSVDANFYELRDRVR